MVHDSNKIRYRLHYTCKISQFAHIKHYRIFIPYSAYEGTIDRCFLAYRITYANKVHVTDSARTAPPASKARHNRQHTSCHMSALSSATPQQIGFTASAANAHTSVQATMTSVQVLNCSYKGRRNVSNLRLAELDKQLLRFPFSYSRLLVPVPGNAETISI